MHSFRLHALGMLLLALPRSLVLRYQPTASLMSACVYRHHFDVEPASHGASDQNKAEELSKEDIKGHKDELKHIQVHVL